jgi:hypothetical protein
VAHRLADGLGGAGLAQLGRNLAVGAGASGWNRPHEVVDAPVEGGRAGEVDHDLREVAVAVGQQRADGRDRIEDRRFGGRLLGDGVGEAAGQPGARLAHAGLGQLDADEPAVVPDQPDGADLGGEEGVALVHANENATRASGVSSGVSSARGGSSAGGP